MKSQLGWPELLVYINFKQQSSHISMSCAGNLQCHHLSITQYVTKDQSGRCRQKLHEEKVDKDCQTCHHVMISF